METELEEEYQFVVDKKLVDPVEHKERNDNFYQAYKEGRLDIKEYLKFSCSVLTRFPMETLHKYREDFVESRIVPLIHSKGIALIPSVEL